MQAIIRSRIKGAYHRLRTMPTMERQPPGRMVRIADIHPEVLKAHEDELIAAGWGEVSRDKIPADWKQGKPLSERAETGRKSESAAGAGGGKG